MSSSSERLTLSAVAFLAGAERTTGADASSSSIFLAEAAATPPASRPATRPGSAAACHPASSRGAGSAAHPPGARWPASCTAPPAAGGDALPTPEPIDVEADEDVTKIDDQNQSEEGGGGDTEELDVTELVDSQKSIETKQEEYFKNLFSQLSNLESKLKDMDQIVSKLNQLENKIEKYREKSPQEKLDLRKYDSYPFNQKLSDFFEDKKDEMEKTGKLDYVLTTDDVTNVKPQRIDIIVDDKAIPFKGDWGEVEREIQNVKDSTRS